MKHTLMYQESRSIQATSTCPPNSTFNPVRMYAACMARGEIEGRSLRAGNCLGLLSRLKRQALLCRLRVLLAIKPGLLQPIIGIIGLEVFSCAQPSFLILTCGCRPSTRQSGHPPVVVGFDEAQDSSFLTHRLISACCHKLTETVSRCLIRRSVVKALASVAKCRGGTIRWLADSNCFLSLNGSGPRPFRRQDRTWQGGKLSSTKHYDRKPRGAPRLGPWLGPWLSRYSVPVLAPRLWSEWLVLATCCKHAPKLRNARPISCLRASFY